MDKYEKSARQIMQRGEKIISQKRKKIREINRISFSVSGLCAALAVIFFINNTDIDNIDKDNMNNSDIIITTTEKFVEHDKKTTEISTNHTISADNKIYSAATTACTSEIISSETAFTEHISSETTEAVSCYIPDEMPDTTQSEGIYEETEISEINHEERHSQEKESQEIECITQYFESIEVYTETETDLQTETTATTNIQAEETFTTPYIVPIDTEIDSFKNDENNIIYNRTDKTVAPQIVSDFIKKITENTISFELYELDGINPEALTAIKFNGKEDFILYKNEYFISDTVEEFVKSYGINKYAVFNSAEYDDFSSGYNLIHCDNLDNNFIWNCLFSNGEAKIIDNISELINSGEISMNDLIRKVTVICNMPDILPYETGFSISEKGYVTTNITKKGMCFFIGEENAKKLIFYVKSSEVK